MIYDLEVVLDVVEPPVMRRLLVEGETTFGELHAILQLAFEWEDSHLHSFWVMKREGREGRTEIGPIPPPGLQDGQLPLDEEEQRLDRWLLQPGDEAVYMYDFGSDWSHRITLKGIAKEEPEEVYPVCIGAFGEPAEEDTFPPEYDGSGGRTPEELVADINDEFNEFADLLDGDLLTDLLAGAPDGPGETFSFGDPDDLDGGPDEEDVREIWSETLSAVKELGKSKPWEFIGSDQVFAIKDPHLAEPIFVSVLGAGGEEFGVVTYYGWEGYSYLLKLFDGTLKKEESLYALTGLAVYLENREDLSKEDYQLIKDHGFSFRGKKQWPCFRNFEPGFAPWIPDPDEAALLTNILSAVHSTVEIIKGGNEVPEFHRDGEMLAYMPDEEDPELMEPVIIAAPILPSEPEIPLFLNELDVKRLQKLPAVDVPFEFGLFRMLGAVQEQPGDRPFFPLIALALHIETGMVASYDLLPATEPAIAAQPALADFLTRIETVPAKLHVDEKTATYLKPLTDKLGIRLYVKKRLNGLEKVMQGMESGMDLM